MSPAGFPLEGTPTDEQKERLENWLSELMLISRKYDIAVLQHEGEVVVFDASTDTTIGLDLVVWLDHGCIQRYDVDSSILDGVWPIDTTHGPREQRAVGSVWPRRMTRRL